MKKTKLFLPLILAAAFLLGACRKQTAAPAAAEESSPVSAPMETAASGSIESSTPAETAASNDTETDAPAEAAAGDDAEAGASVLPPEEERGVLYENEGLRLRIPAEYDALVLTETPQDDAYGVLFSVSEKASVEAAEAAGWTADGAGWLSSIGRIDEARLQALLCYTDLSGVEILAKDQDGNHYVCYLPTDVRYVRESNEAMYRDQEQWMTLTAWAGRGVRESFLAENPGLTPETRGSTELELHLARIEFLPGISYTVSTTQFGPLAPPDGFDATPWLSRLTDGVRYERLENEEAPDGEYVVLAFPEEDLRFDFFLMSGGENYVREVAGGSYELLYRAVFDDGETLASAVMQDWYDALAADRNPI